MSTLRDWYQLFGVLLIAGLITLPAKATQQEVAGSRATASAETEPQATPPTPPPARERPIAATCVIAIVPDPIDSDARWMFDPQIDALHSAALHEGYSLLRYELPDWDAAHPDSPPSGLTHETTPGWILFGRRTAAGGAIEERLSLYLVYETATAGIHAMAMHAALEAATGAACSNATHVPIVGPTFSGSAPSLRRALDDFHAEAHAHDGVTFSIVTGSATSRTNQTTLTGNGMTFNSAVLSDDDVVPALLGFVRSRFLTGRPSVALLVESTPYGNGIAGLSPVESSGYQVLRFPLHISRLRAMQAAQNGARNPRIDEAALPLDLSERFQPTDRLPVITPATTAPAVDLMLHGILDRIRRTRVRAVGLFATDTRDKLFLAREIARAIPGILLFTTDTDILYAHPQYRSVVRGMVVASTYPMVPVESIGGMVPQAAHSFSSSSAVGTFNALVSLLHAPGDVDLLEYASAGQDTPPIWFSITTETGIWPVHYTPPGTAGRRQPYSHLSDHQRGERPGVHASMWTWAASLLVLALAFLHLYADRAFFAPGGIVTHGPLTWVPPPDARHLIHLGVSLVALLTIAVLLAGMWLAGAQSTEEWVALALQLIAAAAAAVTLAATVRRAHVTPPAPDAAPTNRLNAAVIWTTGAVLGALVIGLLAAYVRTVTGAPADVISLFFDRAAHPNSGASPVFAVVAVVFPVYLWGLIHVFGANKMPSHHLFRTIAGNAAGAGAAEWPARFGLACRRPLNAASNAAVLIVLLGIVAAATVMLANGMASAEVPTFTWGVLAAWLLVQLLLSLSLVQTIVVWTWFRVSLRFLASHPLATAYSRVPAQMLGDRLSPRRPRTRDLAPLVHARTLLAAPMAPLARDVRDSRGAALLAASALGAREVPFDADIAGHRSGWTRSATFKALANDADDVRAALAGWWGGEVAADDKALTAWCERGEEFLGMFVVLYVRETLARVTSMLLFMVLAILLLVFAQTVFTFHPRQVLLALTWWYAVITVMTALVVFIAVERDVVLARLASTTEGKVVWDRVFLSKVLIYALIPLATLFAAQFPQIGEVLQQWLSPVRQGLP